MRVSVVVNVTQVDDNIIVSSPAVLIPVGQRTLSKLVTYIIITTTVHMTGFLSFYTVETRFLRLPVDFACSSFFYHFLVSKKHKRHPSSQSLAFFAETKSHSLP